jgi:hypothetical protein
MLNIGNSLNVYDVYLCCKYLCRIGSGYFYHRLRLLDHLVSRICTKQLPLHKAEETLHRIETEITGYVN